MAVTRLLGWERARNGEEGERKGGERRKRRRNEKGKRGRVAPREVGESSVPDGPEPFRDTDWDERRFWQYNFFSSLSFFSSPLLCSLHTVVFMHFHSIWPPSLPPFLFWHSISRFPLSLSFFFFFVKSKGRITLGVVFALHYEISRSPLNENGGEINALPHSPGACKLKKKKRITCLVLFYHPLKSSYLREICHCLFSVSGVLFMKLGALCSIWDVRCSKSLCCS